MITSTKSYKYKGQVYTVYKFPDGIWRDDSGTEYGVSEDENSVDPNPVCGVGWISLPVEDPRNEMCKIHDYQYSCSLYERDHERSQADRELGER
jgi:hypothetical protein